MPEYVVDSKKVIELEVIPGPPPSHVTPPPSTPHVSPVHKPSPSPSHVVPPPTHVSPSPSPIHVPSPSPTKKPLVQKIKEFVSSHKLELLAGLGFLALGAIIFRRPSKSEIVIVRGTEQEEQKKE